VETKALPFQVSEIKATGGEGIIEGWASVFGGPPDTYGDVVVRGAFADSLKRRTPKFLWQHDMAKPIGKVLSLEETDYGLYGRWQLAKTQQAQEAYELMKDGLVDGLSIGFFPEESEISPDGDRLLKKIDLLEISGVTIGANDRALIASVKTDQPLHVLLKQATEALGVGVREAKALHERRAAEGRSLNDQTNAALDEFLSAAEAALELRALRVVPPDAEAEAAEMDLLRLRARLIAARRRTA
jgi:HK97 family phage prohead protease